MYFQRQLFRFWIVKKYEDIWEDIYINKYLLSYTTLKLSFYNLIKLLLIWIVCEQYLILQTV